MTETSYRMSREQVDAFLATPRHAIIAAGPAGGTSQLSPVWYVFEESRLYFSTLVRSAKYRHLRQDPRIAICVDGAHPDARLVSVYGTAEIVEEESPWRAELEWRIARRYHDSDEAARRFRRDRPLARPDPRLAEGLWRESVALTFADLPAEWRTQGLRADSMLSRIPLRSRCGASVAEWASINFGQRAFRHPIPAGDDDLPARAADAAN